jgi:hypothetical protein
MGICYCLQKIDRGEEFDLDKGAWWPEIFYDYQHRPFDRSRFFGLDQFSEKLVSAYNELSFDKGLHLNELHQIAQCIWDWIGDDRIMFYGDNDDAYFEEYAKNMNPLLKDRQFNGPFYKVTGSVFLPFNPAAVLSAEKENEFRENKFFSMLIHDGLNW